jgi:FMN phosphatase YigB (HAD superfamily)
VGYRLGLAGNQSADAEKHLRRLGLPVEFIASSEGWGVEKPSRRFFTRIQEAAQMPASRIAYVGDRLDNDVLPAKQSGMFAVFISRGPWGSLHRDRPEAAQADARLETLDGLLEVLPAKPPFPGETAAWTDR